MASAWHAVTPAFIYGVMTKGKISLDNICLGYHRVKYDR